MISLHTPAGRFLKRSVDVVAASLGLVLSSPIFLLVALAIRLDTPGSVFFRQVRVGRGGRPFRIWKFRSMTEGAHLQGPSITTRTDPRITRVGRVLRGTKLDELPQLINVVRGEMSLVGPRPEVPEYVALYTPEERSVLRARPGITDAATLAYLDEEALLSESHDPIGLYQKTIMHDKLAINLEYQRTATVTSDIAVVLRTLVRLLR